MSWCLWPRLFFLLSIALSISAQASNVTTCIPAYRWSINNLRQTPCLVAAYLASSCGTRESSQAVTYISFISKLLSLATRVDSIPPGNHYVGPTFATADVCKCSTVYYSMMSACGGCQGLSFANWTAWSTNCPESFIQLQRFERTIPSGTTVPNWAFLDVVASNNTFNATAAQLNIGLTPTSSFLPSSSVSDLPPTTTSSPLTSSSSPPVQTQVAEKAGHNAGAIAGGVVGGLVGVAAIVLAILWFCTRKRNAVQKDITFDHQALVGPGSVVSGGSFVNTHHTGHTTSPEPISTMSYSPTPFRSPYESSEMSTYPASPMTSAVYTTVPVTTYTRRSLESVSPSLAQLGPAPGYTPNRGFAQTEI
ncbi:hypothetical protein CVT24_005926 [Panaeolus cyanescens]|uniref:Uncharacterized protein n=1 Tax=Panaeolus cyanescens TaxID=181874 RepID=A0A409V8X9_9AGAR|nr:hypothetical protein CVT24_005926 [Panaeolus cyanescens]